MHWGENTLCICGFGPSPAWILLSHEGQSGLSTNPRLPCCCGLLIAVQSRALVRWLSWVHRCFLEFKLFNWSWLLSELRTQFLLWNSQMCIGCGWHTQGGTALSALALTVLLAWVSEELRPSKLFECFLALVNTTTSFYMFPGTAVFICIRNLKGSWTDNCFQYMKPRRILTCGG